MADFSGIYIKRLLETPAEIERLGAELGVKKPQDLSHVTLIYSKSLVDWENPVFEPVAECLEIFPKVVFLDRFGSHLVIRFESGELQARYRKLVGEGVVSDHFEFQPHITIGSDAEGRVDLETQIALNRPLIFGPELRKVPKECLSRVR